MKWDAGTARRAGLGSGPAHRACAPGCAASAGPELWRPPRIHLRKPRARPRRRVAEPRGRCSAARRSSWTSRRTPRPRACAWATTSGSIPTSRRSTGASSRWRPRTRRGNCRQAPRRERPVSEPARARRVLPRAHRRRRQRNRHPGRHGTRGQRGPSAAAGVDAHRRRGVPVIAPPRHHGAGNRAWAMAGQSAGEVFRPGLHVNPPTNPIVQTRRRSRSITVFIRSREPASPPSNTALIAANRSWLCAIRRGGGITFRCG